MSKIYDTLQHLEAQRKAMAGGTASETSSKPLDLQEHPVVAASREPRVSARPLLEQAAAITRFGAELHRRMGEAGLNGLQGLFALADQLQRALAVISQPELETVEADLERVANHVRSMQDGLRQLKAVKTDLEGLTGLAKL